MEDTIAIRIFDNFKKIRASFAHNHKDISYYANLVHRDNSMLFIKKGSDNWYSTNHNSLIDATFSAITGKTSFDARTFMYDYYENKEIGTGTVAVTLREWQELAKKGKEDLMLFVVHPDNRVSITRNKIFIVPPILSERQAEQQVGILKHCRNIPK